MASTDAGLSSLALATYSTNTYYSTYFDGSTGALNIPNNAVFNLGATDFTVEAWVYRTGGGGRTAQNVLNQSVAAAASNSSFYFGAGSDGCSLYLSTSGTAWTNNIETATAPAVNTWTHIAWQRRSNVLQIYLNGVLQTVASGTAAFSGTVFSSTRIIEVGTQSAAGYFTGYISNLRLVKGSSVYTGAFNPPTIQLTAITNTVLLTCQTNGVISLVDNSVNNATITRIGNTGFKQFTPLLQANASVTLSPTFTTGTTSYSYSASSNIAAISITPTAVDPALATIKYNGNVTLTSGQANIAASGPYFTNGYSGYFTAGLFQYANAAPVNVQGYSWTAEMWVYPIGTYTGNNTLFSKRTNGSTVTSYEGYLASSTGYLNFFNGTAYSSNYALPITTWSHVVYTYDGNAITIYVNGNRIYSVAVTVTDVAATPLTIGGKLGYGSEMMIGNISNFRFVKGYSVYTQAFTPPAQPLSLTQSSSTGVRAIISSDINSGFFSGTNAYLTVPGTGITNIFTGDFTIEAWLYPTAAFGASWVTADGGFSDMPVMICNASPTSLNYYWAFGPTSTGTVRFITSSIYYYTVTSTATCTVNAWNHLAVVKNGSIYKIYVNGVGSTEVTMANPSYSDAVGISIGANNSKYVTGYISNARIVKGTAVYTVNFTPSTIPLTAITNTSLLALQNKLTTDASTNNLTLTNTNVTLSTSITPFTSTTGSTQFLSTALAYQQVSNPYVPALSLGQGHNNFTAEAWVYLTATAPAAPGWYIIQKGTNSTPGLEWSFSITSTGLYFQTTSGIPTGTTTSTAFTANVIPGQWMHLALTKVGTTVNLWFNGFYTGTVNGVNNLYYTAQYQSYITIANTQTGATTAFAGFISNARVVYGKALYTVNYDSSFIPSTTALTTTQSATSTTASIDNASSYTVNNGSSIFYNGTNDFLTFPEPASNFYSAQFNGSNQYISTPNTAVLNLGTGDFTIEFWFNIYSDSTAGADTYKNATLLSMLNSSGQLNGWAITIFGDTNTTGTSGVGLYNFVNDAGTSVGRSLTALSKNTWYHFALSCISGTSKLFMNGVLADTQTASQNLTNSNALWVGASAQTSYQRFFNGFISNLRIVKGTGLYSSNFTPSSIPLTTSSQGATSSQVSLLTTQSATIRDNSPVPLTLTNNNTVTVSPIHPFTTYGDGTNVTVEAWVMLGAAPTTRGWIINNSATSTGYFGVAIETARTITVWSDSNATAVLTSSTVIPLYTWTHIAVTFVNQLLVIYINGVRDTNTIGKSTVWQAATLGTVYIGRQASSAAQYFPGYITNLRMVYGTPLYTSKFSVPTSPLTAIPNTVFLGLQSSATLDNSVNNATITKGSGATGLILSPLTSPFTSYLPSVTNGYSVALGWGIAVNSATTGVYYSSGLITAGQLPGDFTMECWLYLSVLSSGVAALFDNRAALTDAGYVWYINTNGTFAFFGNNAAVLTSTAVLAINTWYHLAITRQNGTMRTWVNGILDASVTGSLTDYGRTNGNFYLNNTSAPGLVTGYVSNLRFIQGTAIYTGTFTPSITPYSLTSSASTNTLAVTGITTYPSVTNPNGINYSGSYYFGGGTTNVQQINMANSGNAGRFEIGIYDFTIEAWFNCTATSAGTYTIVSAGNATAGYTDYAWSVYVYKTSATAGILGFQSYIGSSSFNPTYTGNISSNQWYHMAIVRIGTSFNMYLNGVSVATSTIFNTPAYVPLGSQLPASTIAIGALYSTAPYTNNFYGYISNVRVMKGYGVYTGAFTPPTGPLSNTQSAGSINISAITGTSTSLLALQNATTTDASTNNFTLTATGSPTLSSTVFPAFAVTNGYSGYFNGGSAISVNGGLTGALNGLTSGTTGDWTVECWVYMTGTGPTGTDYGGAYDICGTSDVRTSIGFIIGITNVGYLLMARGGGYVNVNNTIPSMNTWAHLAFVNSGTTMTIYLNGTALSNTVSLTGTWAPSAYTLTSYIGSSGYGGFTGYISNFRAVGGVAVYTGNFTVPTSPLTATQSAGTNISAITAGQTKLLVLQNSLYTDASASNYTLTVIQQSSYYCSLSTTITPFAATNGYSVRFTGSTQYLNAPSNIVFTFGTGDFTIEGWIYLNSGTSGTLYDSRTGLTTVSPQIYIASNVLNYAVAGVSVITGSTITSGLWNHVAVTRISGSTKLYVNGTQSGSTYTDTNNYVIGSPYIGTGYNTSNPLNGYISNLRVVKGVGIYTNTFTSPATPLTSTQSSSGTAIALGNTIPSLGNSVYFNGTTDYMKVPSNVSFMGTGDFTIETYYYPTSFAAVTTLFGQYTAATTGIGIWEVQITTAGIITVYYNGSTNFTASTAILVNEWYHIALVRISGIITLFVNGVSYGTTSFATQFGQLVISAPLYIGAQQSAGPTQYAMGYMSNLRIVKGLGVYTISSITNSVSFSGTSQYITTPTNSGFTFGTGDFTVEMWFYKTGSNLQQCLVGGTGNLPEFEFDASASVSKVRLFDGVLGGGNGLYGSTTINSNQWYHVAWVKIGSTYTVYLNGTSEASGTSTVNYTGTQFRIGARLDGTTAFTGYITNLRIVKGTGVYTGNFAVPTVPLTATQSSGTNIAAISAGVAGTSGTQLLALQTGVTNDTSINGLTLTATGTPPLITTNPFGTTGFTVPTSPLSATQSSGTNIAAITSGTSLLLYQNSPFTDNSTNNNIVTGFGNPQYSPVFSPSFFTYPTPVNGNSGYFNGSTAYLSLAQPANAGTNDFTIECWIYPTAIGTASQFISTEGTSTLGNFHIGLSAANLVNFYVDQASSPNITSTTIAKINTWTHVAVVRPSGSLGTIYMFVNGIKQGTTVNKTTQFGTGGTLNIGRYQPGLNQYFTGYITNLRFVYGYGLYSGTSIYFVPNYSTPLATVTGTTLLLLQSTLTKDNSANNITVTNTNVILSRYTNPYTMLQLPALLTAQNSRDVTSTTGFRDNSMYNATLTSGSLSYASHQNTVSPFGVTPTLLIGQSSLTSDNSINNYSGSLTNSPYLMPYVTPFSGSAVAFNGSTQYITGTSLYNSLGGDFTIEFFMMAGPQTATNGALLLGKNVAYATATNNNYYIMCSHAGANQSGANSLQTIQIHSSAYSTSTPLFIGATPVCDSKWHHIAIVRISNIVKVYIDGVLDTNSNNSFTNTGIWDYSSYTIGSNPTDGVSTVAQLAYNGMLSNLRIINGTGIYTGTFTPPTNTLTKSQTSGTNIASYTPSVPPNINSYGLSFRGVEGTTLYTSYSGASNPLNADYTIEFWHFLTSKPSGSTTPALFSNGSMSAGGITMFAGHSSGTVTKYQISFNGGTNNLSWLESTNNIVYGKWTHIALVRISGTLYFYINGLLDSSTRLANYTVFSPETPSSSYMGAWQLGGSLGSTGTYISGFISNFRVVRGIGVYTGNFTVPTSALTLTQSSGTNIAAIPSPTIYTNGNATIFGPAGYQSLATSPYMLSTGSSDFTVEAWVLFYIMPTVDTWTTGCSVLFSGDGGLTTGMQFVIGRTQLFVVMTNTLYSGSATHNMVTGNWYHIAYVRISNNIYFYVNGVRVGTAYGVSSVTSGITTTYIGTAAANGNYGFNGYISNLRFIKGLGAYTNAFTPSTTPLSMNQTAGSNNISAITGTSTSLLALQNSLSTDASTNNLTLSYATNTTLNTFSPFAAVNGYSGYFNGISGSGASYMQGVTSITSQNVGGLNALSSGSTGDYTIECWVYQMGTPAGAAYTNSYTLCASTNGSSTFYCSYIAITVSGYLFYTRDGGSAINVTATTPTLNAWTHLAFVNVGTTMYIYVNGVQQTNTGALTGTWSTTGTYSTIGGLAGNYAFNGYISNFRAVANIALYTGNFTVPTSPLSITQNSSTNINPLSAPISTYAGYFNAYTGTQYITTPPNSTFAFGTGNFTVEFWFYSHSISSNNSLFELNLLNNTANNTLNSAFEIWTGGSTLRVTSGSGITYYITGTTTLWSYTWYHVMVTRSNLTTMQMFLNGVQEGNTYTASATQNFTNNQVRIGYGLSPGYMYGYISNYRIINGQALATSKFVVSSSTLTASTVGHTGSGVAGSITGTVSLLTLQNSTIIDNGNGNAGSGFTITNGTSNGIVPTTNSTVTMSALSILPSVRTQLLLLQNSLSIDASVGNYLFTPSQISMSASVTPFAVTNGNSAYFVGSSITAPSNSVFTFGTGDFTIEGWMYISVGSSGTLFDGRTSTNSIHPVIYISSLVIKYRVAGTDVITGSTLNNSTWYHIALVRISGSTKLYVNGVQSGTTYADTNNYLICGPSFGVGYQNNNPLIGYISNLRVVKGTGVYLSTYAPSMIPLTSTQSASTGKLAVSVTPYNGSIYYPGSTYQYSTTANALYSFGIGDFTIEAYIYMTTYSSSPAIIVTSGAFSDTTSTDKWQLYVMGNTNGLNFTTIGSGLACIGIFPNAWVTYRWYHVAVVRRNGVIKLYVNGVAGTSLNNVGNANNYILTQNGLTIGAGANGNYFTGFISNLRLIKTALYNGTDTSTANFTVPTSPLGNYQNASTNITGITNPTTAITNGSSVLFNGTTDYLRVASYSALNFGSNNYTIECWFYTTTVNTTQMILSKVSNKTTYDFYLKLNADDGTGGGAGQLEFYQGNIGTGKTLMGIIFPNTWYHVTVYRYSGTTYYMYVNGTNAFVGGYLITSTNPAYDATNDLNIGVDGVDYNSKFFSGYITNLRITNGVGIYYNFPGNIFNPPQAPLGTVQSILPGMGAYATTAAQTAFLGLQTSATTDSSVNNATITAYGTPTVSTSVRPFTLPNNLGYSLYFNGNQSGASGSNITGYVDLFNNSSIWTIELWYYQGATSNATYGTLVDFNYSNANDICIRVDVTKVYYTVCTSANSQINVITSSTNALSGWNHVALVKGIGIITLYLNGANAGTAGSTWSATARGGPGLGYNTSFTQTFTGYISNFRIVKDVAVYTSPFTVPTSPFTNPQIIPSTISAITSGQTSLLVLQNSTTADNSGNSLTLTATGSPTLSSAIVPSFPGAINSNGYSAFFGGANSGYLNVNSGANGLSALSSGTTGDYTVECWVYMTVAPTGTTVVTSSIICSNTNGGTSIWFVIAVTSTGYIFYDRAGGATVTVTGTTPTLNTWAHLAFVNAGTTMNIYLNGTKLANTASLTGTWATSATYTTLGCYASGQGGFFNGYITNFRAVAGVQVYTGNFTVPTSPLAATQSSGTNISAITTGQTKLLALQTATVTADTGANTFTFNNGGNVSSSTQTPFVSTYGYSVGFTGSTQYLTAPSNIAFTFGTGDFTIEGWIYLSSGTTGTLFDNRTGASTVSPQIYITGSVIYYATAGTNRITGPSISTATWYHIAVSRVSSVTTMYVNGFLVGSAYADSNSYVIGSPYIGTGFGTSNALVGYISNLRVVKGLGVYTTGFFTPTTPLSATQSTGPNTTVNAYTLILQSGQTDAATGTTTPTFAAQTTFGGAPLMSPFYLPSAMPSLIAAQGYPINVITGGGSVVQPLYRDNSTFNVQTITTGSGSPVMDKGTSPFIQSTSLLAVQSYGAYTDNGPSGFTMSGAGAIGVYSTAVSPFNTVPTVMLVAQSNSISSTGFSALADQANVNYVQYGANAAASIVNGPFNSDTPLLTLQNAVILDNSNNRSQMTVVGGGVSPTDSSPFTSSKSLTSLLIPYGYNDISISNTGSNYIANNANVAQTNFVYNPFTILSTAVSAILLQTSNVLFDSSINNVALITNGTAPTSNTTSPFGTYYANGILTLNTNSTTGIYGSNIVTFANLLVTAGDAVTTNAYSITITSLNNVGNIGNRTNSELGLLPAQSNANISLVDLGNTSVTEATILTFANTSITPTLNVIDYGYATAPSNTTFIITDVANSNLGETLNSIFISNVSVIKIPTDSGLGQVAPSNTTFFISDVANSNISETIANVTISNVSTTRSIIDTGTQPPPSPVGGTILFPTYAYTDGVTITAANVQGGGSGSSAASNQQVWYQT